MNSTCSVDQQKIHADTVEYENAYMRSENNTHSVVDTSLYRLWERGGGRGNSIIRQLHCHPVRIQIHPSGVLLEIQNVPVGDEIHRTRGGELADFDVNIGEVWDHKARV